MSIKDRKYIVGAFFATIGVSLIVILIKKYQLQKRLTIISEEGYETAHDVNFPLKVNNPRRQKRIV
jgi:hypothetical protein